MIKPDFETISPDTGHSYKYAYFDSRSPNTNKIKWHYHPEVELVYINSGVGKRQVGTHLSNYQDGDLILIGSYLPHTGFTKGSHGYLPMKGNILNLFAVGSFTDSGINHVTNMETSIRGSVTFLNEYEPNLYGFHKKKSLNLSFIIIIIVFYFFLHK